MFFVPPCRGVLVFIPNCCMFNSYWANDYLSNKNRMLYGSSRQLPSECQGAKEQPNSLKYYYLKYCQTNNCKCLICFKPIPPPDVVTTPGENMPIPSGWYNIQKIDGGPNAFTITVQSLLKPETVSSNDILFVKITYVPLSLFWNSKLSDNASIANKQGQQDAIKNGYQFIRIEGYIYPYQAPGTVPLKLYWSSQRGDMFSTATKKGESDALAAGYQFVRVEGYIYTSHVSGTVPLKLYWSSQRGDNFSTATAQGEAAAIAAGYKFVRVEGYIFPH